MIAPATATVRLASLASIRSGYGVSYTRDTPAGDLVSVPIIRMGDLTRGIIT